MIQCHFCGAQHVPNTIFCDECGAYLLSTEELRTDPLEGREIEWSGETDVPQASAEDSPGIKALAIRLRIGEGEQARELELPLAKPIHLGRMDPSQDILPDVDLTGDQAVERGVSRNHARILQHGNVIQVEDLGSINGTTLNGKRLAPYVPVPLKDGDRLRLGKLAIEVSIVS